MLEVNDFNAIRISLASPEQIRGWSYGEVTKPETINYRTLKPEKDGLFCERIFGPMKDWECYCGKYKRVRFKGIVCDKCGVEVARSKVRRERMGHIELASPVSHIWYFKGTPSRIGLLLDLSPRNLERILYFALYVITDIDEEARQRELMHLDEELLKLDQNLDEQVVELVDQLKDRRDSDILKSRNRIDEDRVEAEARREQELEAARQAESDTLAKLRAAIGQAADEDIIFEPTGQVIVAEGDVVTPKHLESLEQKAEIFRNDIAENARREIEATRLENDRDAERTKLEYQGQIDSAQSRLEVERVSNKQRLEQLRRDLEGLKKMDLLQEGRYRELKDAFSGVFRASMGAEAVRELIAGLDLDKLAVDLRREIGSTVGQRRKKATKRLKVVEAFRKSNTSPEWMILTVLPVLPPDLRPMVQLDGGRFATSDLNDLYRRVINRNNRLKRLLELSAPEIIIRNEKRMLQEACDALIDNGRRGRAVAGSGNHKLKSLSDMLKGKQGRFRQNLLGKRVDYSGRSVIVVGPELKLHQCGLPKRMALELFKPFIYHRLEQRGHCTTIKAAKEMVERQEPVVWDILEDVIRDHPVLLKRARTLHRLGIQAFGPVLVEGKAIKIHPLVCTAFNADFDGDQMAVHIPLSPEAQIEASVLMLSTQNLLSPASGQPVAVPTQDMVLGVYYLTRPKPGAKGEGRTFGSIDEVLMAWDSGEVETQSAIRLRYSGPLIDMTTAYDEQAIVHAEVQEVANKIINTTVGRVILYDNMPKGMPFINGLLKKKGLGQLVSYTYLRYGPEMTVTMLDHIKELGFYYATKAGITISIDDLIVPPGKRDFFENAQNEVVQVDQQYRDGAITNGERYNKVIAIWSDVTEKISDMMFNEMERAEEASRGFNPILLMADSGARGSKQQIRQLAGMRGLMAKPSGEIIETPITANFREGLTVQQYFISTHGARKGLADTALKTADSGYLTRRLVDVAQDVIISEGDCGTVDGIYVGSIVESGEIIEPLRDRIVGRVSLEKIKDYEGHVIVEINQEISEDLASAIQAAGIERVKIRSVLTCESRRGACVRCYGRNLATGKLVEIGEAVGVIAAQSIGEPGTQLTMRTFHTGGVAGIDITQGLPRVEELLEARIQTGKSIISEIDGEVEIIRTETARKVKVTSRDVYDIPYILTDKMQPTIESGATVQEGEEIARGAGEDGEVKAIQSRASGVARVERNQIVIRSMDEEWREYPIPHGSRVNVQGGQKIKAGQQITEGSISPQELLHILGREAVQTYLVEEVQKVYRSQGVDINDKHIEVIIRQMMRKVRVDTAGDTDLLPGEIVS